MSASFLAFNPPPEGAAGDPQIALQWIIRHVPCFVGPVPMEWSEAVYRESLQWRIDGAIIRAALRLARQRGYQFADPIALRVIGPPRLDTGPRVTTAYPNARAGAIAMAKELERQFKMASVADNVAEMERLAKQFADLLNSARVQRLPLEEIQHGAPLLRRAIVEPYGAPSGGRGGPPSGGGPYRVPGRLPPRLPPRAGR